MVLKSNACARAVRAGAVLSLSLVAAHALANPLPPAGLYRIDTDATTRTGAHKQRHFMNGVDGSGFHEGQKGNEPPHRVALPGSGPATICLSAPAHVVPPARSCKGAPMVVNGNSATSSFSCDFMDMTTVIRKLNETTWEYRTTTAIRMGAVGTHRLPDFAAQRKMFEHTAKHGATAEERAEAAATLADWSQYVAEAREFARENDNTSLDPARDEQKSTMVARWTRIADKCKPAPVTRP